MDETIDHPLLPSPETPVAAVSRSKPIITLAIIFLIFYLTLGVGMYTLFRDQFSGDKTNLWVDSLYFSIVTLSTVGYGDIFPKTTNTKILTIVLVLVGVISLDYLLNRVVSHVLDLQENAILDRIRTGNRTIRAHIIDEENGRIRTKWKLQIAFCVVFCCVVVGAMFLYFHEKLSFLDSVYLSVISVTTVGYGDKKFKTVQGRAFAVVWLLFSIIAMATFFFYCAEMRIDRSTTSMVPALSESELIISKLKESGKITEEDIIQVRREFENRDPNID